MKSRKRRYSQKDKHKFRQSSPFLKLKEELLVKSGNLDHITHHSLKEEKTSCHHLDMRNTEYTDLTDINKFILLNESTHRAVHIIYSAYRKDETVLDRLKEVLERMKCFDIQEELRK